MALTPVEVRHLALRRGLFGYRRSDVHREVEHVADSFEAVWRERAELGERRVTSSSRTSSARRSCPRSAPPRT